MAFVSIYFSLGSNLGDKKNNILKALELMDDAFGNHYSELSRFIETKPMGFSGAKFINAAVMYRIHRPDASAEENALDVLSKIKAIERQMGRTDAPEYDSEGNRKYHSRIIDIDILFYGAERISHPRLTVPHVGIKERPFVTIPLMEIAKPSLKTAFPEYF